VDRDYEKIVKTVTDFLGSYNDFISLLNKETSTKPDDEGNQGSFPGDYNLVSMVSNLRNFMMNPYQTKYSDKLSLLAQIGVSTNESGSFTMDANKLRGILEVNEDKFIDMMQKYPDGVKELFGTDTNGDLMIDNGLAFKIQNYLQLYTTKRTGVYDTRDNEFDRKIENKNKEIVSYKEKMDKEEEKLRKDFTKMQKAMDELEENKKKFDDMNNK
jgi:flagellar hook-associated protein 2